MLSRICGVGDPIYAFSDDPDRCVYGIEAVVWEGSGVDVLRLKQHSKLSTNASVECVDLTEDRALLLLTTRATDRESTKESHAVIEYPLTPFYIHSQW